MAQNAHQDWDEEEAQEVVIHAKRARCQTEHKLEQFAFSNQTHTLGRTLQASLQEDSRIEFAGYRQPRALEPNIEMQIKRAPETTESTNAILLEHCRTLKKEWELLDNLFRREIARVSQT